MPTSSSSVSALEAPIAAAATTLASGELVVYPTETVYGLGADASQEAALRRLVELKGRAARQPISVLVATIDMAREVARSISQPAELLMRRFWPGPLTIVFDAQPTLSPLLTGGSGTIGVRLSSHHLATALVRAFGKPVTTPSANPAGQPPPTRIESARAYFGARVRTYIDGGLLPGEPASTIVDARQDIRIIRHGAIIADEIYAALRAA